MIIICERCICVPVCRQKDWIDVLKCQYLQDHLATYGDNLKHGDAVIVGVIPLNKRFMVTRTKVLNLVFGFLENPTTEHWGKEYGGTKSVRSATPEESFQSYMCELYMPSGM